MNVENYFISTFRSSQKYIGDDGACIGKWVYSKDLFFENVHFKRKWLTPYQIGYKAMIINISDAVAMNATPKYALLGVAMPKSMSLHEMDELSRGMQEATSQYGVEIIGGDTIGNSKLDLSITIVSHASHPLLRRGIKKGDVIAYTGTIGQSAKELNYLLSGGKTHSKSRFVAPRLRQGFVRRSRRYLRAGMDISDGLFSDVEKLCSVNRMRIRFEKKIAKKIGCSGEEYEMLIAFSPKRLSTIRRIAAVSRTPVTVVGKVQRGRFTNRCKRHHF
ncbi:thiamine-phosphate kinase [Sulfuricurvum sp.]|uniref:thiamine-phosphate kinase n=1 Tax=Sulfuricurvum sp. TaxID=2025608 RepID=UPI00261AAEA7|nr:thiamine-phosphate kinase [Sulfuricurvum sp.]MDD2266807.1 thiamine-phosphate kinase [Sulfuricurvum sp.]MDD2784721.1 thiamine-phosphate kinase [Sulfuricurvum sp.]